MNVGFHRLGLCIAAPLVAIAALLIIAARFSGSTEAMGQAIFFGGMCIFFALIGYAASRALGWVISGFASKS